MPANPLIAERVAADFERAAQANWSCPTRCGNVVHLTHQDSEDLIVTGDLHGQRLNFRKILDIADLKRHPKRHLLMQEVCHGGPTYPRGGGCMSHLMLEDVARLTIEYPERFHFLLSNHELAELTDYPIIKSRRMLNLLFRTGLEQMYGARAEGVRRAAQQFIASCPLAIRVEGGVMITHSIPEQTDLAGFDVGVFERPLQKGDLSNDGAVFRMVWGRDYRESNAFAFAGLNRATVLITGHEPCPEGFNTPNACQVIVDCCGRHSSYLTLPVGPKWSHGEVVNRIEML